MIHRDLFATAGRGVVLAGLAVTLLATPFAAIADQSTDAAAGAAGSSTSTVQHDGWYKSDGGFEYWQNGQKIASRWILDHNTWYYLSDNGVALTGRQTINGADYYFDLQTCGMAVGWVQTADGTWYLANDSGKLQTGWREVGAHWYWLDPDTDAMQTGLKEIGGTSYLLSSSGAMTVGWGTDPDTNQWCLAGDSGALKRGWQSIDDTWYFIDDDYHMLTGAQEINGSQYFLKSSGAMATGWVKTEAGWYFADDSGVLASGWLPRNGSWYWLDPETKIMATGFLDLGNAKYFLNSNGDMAVGWIKENGDWYYAAQSGALTTGWQKIDGKWYWLDPTTNAMTTGILTVSSKTYYLDASGAMIRSLWLSHGESELWFAESGELEATLTGDAISYADPTRPPASGLTTIGGRTYYVEPETGHIHHGGITINGTEHLFDEMTGQAITGWHKDANGSWTYLDSAGARVHGWVTSGGRWYYLNEQGVMQTGWEKVGSNWYWLEDDGSMATGWKNVGGTWYYLNDSGAMTTDWINDGGTWYWCASSGAMATGWNWIDSTWYDLGGSGAWVTTHYHNIEWAGQPNNYYCGPTSGFMVLRNVGAWTSASGTPLSIENVAQYMDTDAYGYTSFQDRWFMRGMNAWLGSDVYTSVHTPSYETVRDAVMNSYRNGYATVLDEQERRGGPHFNGHNNGTFAHIMVVDGYDQSSDAVYIADPGAPTLWPSGSGHFWYWSLRDFVETYMQTEINSARERIGVHFAK